jgi:hypothetical protein
MAIEAGELKIKVELDKAALARSFREVADQIDLQLSSTDLKARVKSSQESLEAAFEALDRVFHAPNWDSVSSIRSNLQELRSFLLNSREQLITVGEML